MEFCPKCGKRLIYKHRSKGTLYCPECGYKCNVSKEELLKKNFSVAKPSKSRIVVLSRKALDLRTLPTVDAYCHKCGHTKAETWTVAVGSISASSITFFRCVSCGYTWREVDQG